jgi:hypothetical protein
VSFAGTRAGRKWSTLFPMELESWCNGRTLLRGVPR